MTKPQEFREQRTIQCDTQYKVVETRGKGPQSGVGVLTTGRVVWIEGTTEHTAPIVTAYAEGIGVVSVSAGSIKA